MPWAAAAAIGGALIGAWSSSESDKSRQEAAMAGMTAEERMGYRNMVFQQAQANQQRSDFAPWRTMGEDALNDVYTGIQNGAFTTSSFQAPTFGSPNTFNQMGSSNDNNFSTPDWDRARRDQRIDAQNQPTVAETTGWDPVAEQARRDQDAAAQQADYLRRQEEAGDDYFDHPGGWETQLADQAFGADPDHEINGLGIEHNLFNRFFGKNGGQTAPKPGNNQMAANQSPNIDQSQWRAGNSNPQGFSADPNINQNQWRANNANPQGFPAANNTMNFANNENVPTSPPMGPVNTRGQVVNSGHSSGGRTRGDGTPWGDRPSVPVDPPLNGRIPDSNRSPVNYSANQPAAGTSTVSNRIDPNSFKSTGSFRGTGLAASSFNPNAQFNDIEGFVEPEDFNGPEFKFDGVNLEEDPGYQHRMTQGVNALDMSAASRGRLRSGAQDKALTRFGQNEGSQEFQNAYNRQYGAAKDTYGREYGAEYDRYNRDRTAETERYNRDNAYETAAYDREYQTDRDKFSLGEQSRQASASHNLMRDMASKDYSMRQAQSEYDRRLQDRQLSYQEAQDTYNREYQQSQDAYARDLNERNQNYNMMNALSAQGQAAAAGQAGASSQLAANSGNVMTNMGRSQNQAAIYAGESASQRNQDYANTANTAMENWIAYQQAQG